MTTNSLISQHSHHHSADDADLFGFWLYILSDCILFATLFACYVMYNTGAMSSSDLHELISLPYVFGETIVLLLSSLTYGMAMLSLYARKLPALVCWLLLTMVCGAIFIGMELNEFIQLHHEGHGWQTSASMSAFYTLVGTHGLHVLIGLIWMSVLLVQIKVFNLTAIMAKRLTYLALFWTFLDIIWIFVYTIVYLIGAL